MAEEGKPEKQEALDRAEALQKAYRLVFLSEAGQEVMEDLEKQAFFKTTTSLNPHPHATFLNEGRRQLLLYIKTVVETPPEELVKYIEMMEEPRLTEDFGKMEEF
jgi:hypothetical protein